MTQLTRLVCLTAIISAWTALAGAQSAADRCSAFATQIQVQMSQPGVPALCSRLEEVRSVCNQVLPGTGDQMLKGYAPLCDMKRNEAKDAADRAERQRHTPTETVPGVRQDTGRSAQNQSSQAPTEASLHSNRDQIMQAVPALLQQSLSRTKINQADLATLIELGKRLGEAYFEKRDGSSLAYTSKQDDALADSRGYRKRESANFAVFYRTGDMVRAETTLANAEASIAPITDILHHFPSVVEHHGRKLPIYLASTPTAYVSISKCSANSIACVTHVFFDDGDIQTMYVSPRSYEIGSRAAERAVSYKRTVQHELTHYAQFDMVTTDSVRLTRWFIEGLASYVAGEHERMAALQIDGKSGRSLLSFADLQRGEADIYNSTNALLYYEEGYSIFDMLVSTQGMEKTVALILDVIQQEDFEHALAKTLGLTASAFDAEWRSFEASKYGVILPDSRGLNTRFASADNDQSASTSSVLPDPGRSAEGLLITMNKTLADSPLQAYDAKTCNRPEAQLELSGGTLFVNLTTTGTCRTFRDEVDISSVDYVSDTPQGPAVICLSGRNCIAHTRGAEFIFTSAKGIALTALTGNLKELISLLKAPSTNRASAAQVNAGTASQAGAPTLADTIAFIESHTLLGSPFIGRGTVVRDGETRRFEQSWTWTEYRFEGCRVHTGHTDEEREFDPVSKKIVGAHLHGGTPEPVWTDLSKLKPSELIITDVASEISISGRENGGGITASATTPMYHVGFEKPIKTLSCKAKNSEAKLPPEEHPNDWACATNTTTHRDIFFVSEDKTMAERFIKAFTHAIELCGGKSEAF